MSKQEYSNAAQAASFKSLMSLRAESCEARQSISSVISALLHPSAPPPPVDYIQSNIYLSDDSRPGRSGRVRVHPGNFSFYFSSTYTLRPGSPGEKQHTRVHARARGKSLLSSDTYFILKVKVPGQPGHAFNIRNLRSDIHPDAPGLPGLIICGGISSCL